MGPAAAATAARQPETIIETVRSCSPGSPKMRTFIFTEAEEALVREYLEDYIPSPALIKLKKQSGKALGTIVVHLQLIEKLHGLKVKEPEP